MPLMRAPVSLSSANVSRALVMPHTCKILARLRLYTSRVTSLAWPACLPLISKSKQGRRGRHCRVRLALTCTDRRPIQAGAAGQPHHSAPAVGTETALCSTSAGPSPAWAQGLPACLPACHFRRGRPQHPPPRASQAGGGLAGGGCRPGCAWCLPGGLWGRRRQQPWQRLPRLRPGSLVARRWGRAEGAQPLPLGLPTSITCSIDPPRPLEQPVSPQEQPDRSKKTLGTSPGFPGGPWRRIDMDTSSAGECACPGTGRGPGEGAPLWRAAHARPHEGAAGPSGAAPGPQHPVGHRLQAAGGRAGAVLRPQPPVRPPASWPASAVETRLARPRQPCSASPASRPARL